MGSSLVNRAIAMRPNWPQLSGVAMQILYRMCLTALDHDGAEMPACHYFAGWRPLAMMLGYKDSGDDESMHPAAHRAVARGIRELTDCGVIGRAPPEIQAGYKHRVYVIRI